MELRKRNPEQTAALCPPCHRHVHRSLSNSDLERDYASVEALKTHPDIRRFTEWVKGKPHGRT